MGKPKLQKLIALLPPGFSRLRGLAVLTLLLAGCASTPPETDSDVLTPIAVTAHMRLIPSEIRAVLQRPEDLWGRVGYQLTWQHDEPAVELERKKLLAQPRLFTVLSERASPAFNWIVGEVEKRGLPMELALVPIIESMLDPWAYSSQRAAGLWQISPATAHHYGLEINWWYDARLDIPVATDFALNYLEELHKEFNGDWQLALAAYNGGRGRVSRALKDAERRGVATDYWSLKLPRETRRYVPKLLALSSIIKTPEQWSLILPNLSADVSVMRVATGGQIELARAANLAQMEAGELRRLNPAHLRWATAPEGPGELWIPSDRISLFQDGLAQLSDDQRVEWSHYRIAAGDSLSAIAHRFDTQVNLIKEVNGIQGSFIRAGDELMIPKGGNWQGSLQVAARDWPPDRRPRQHKVRPGDSLWSIAQRYDLEVDSLTRWNRLDPQRYLQPGQTLQLTP